MTAGIWGCVSVSGRPFMWCPAGQCTEKPLAHCEANVQPPHKQPKSNMPRVCTCPFPPLPACCRVHSWRPWRVCVGGCCAFESEGHAMHACMGLPSDGESVSIHTLRNKDEARVSGGLDSKSIFPSQGTLSLLLPLWCAAPARYALHCLLYAPLPQSQARTQPRALGRRLVGLGLGCLRPRCLSLRSIFPALWPTGTLPRPRSTCSLSGLITSPLHSAPTATATKFGH